MKTEVAVTHPELEYKSFRLLQESFIKSIREVQEHLNEVSNTSSDLETKIVEKGLEFEEFESDKSEYTLLYELDRSNIIIERAFNGDQILKDQVQELNEQLNYIITKLKIVSRINNLAYKIINSL